MATGTPQTGDRELIAAVLKGDEESFSELVERYQGRLVNYLFRLLRDVDEAHDLAQEVFLKIYQALDRYDPQYKFSTWLFRVARNAAIDRIRKRRLHFVSMDRRRDDDGPEGDLGAQKHRRRPVRESPQRASAARPSSRRSTACPGSTAS